MRKQVSTLIIAILALLLLGCPGPLATGGDEIHGVVQFPEGFRTQATVNEIANAATVSLIDTTTSTTVATTRTRADGSFVLSFPGWRPSAGVVYFLEAIKGLSSNRVGMDAARLRTMIRFENGGWVSLNSQIPGSTIFISRSTTAISAVAGLKQGSSTPVNEGSLIGTLTVGSPGGTVTPPDTFAGATNFTVLEFETVWRYVDAAIVQDADPIASITWDSSTGAYGLSTNRGPLITSLVPNSGAAGSEVSINGVRFSGTAGANRITFGGVVATVLSESETSIRVRVPAGASTGFVVVETSMGSSNGVPFMILANVNGGFRGQAHD